MAEGGLTVPNVPCECRSGGPTTPAPKPERERKPKTPRVDHKPKAEEPKRDPSLPEGLAFKPFNALVGDLVAALDFYNVPEQEKNDLLAILGPMKPDIVGQ